MANIGCKIYKDQEYVYKSGSGVPDSEDHQIFSSLNTRENMHLRTEKTVSKNQEILWV